MTNEVEMQKNTIVNKKFSDQELYRITWRWSLFLATIWNYEKMEAAGYLITMAPALDKLYESGGNHFRNGFSGSG